MPPRRGGTPGSARTAKPSVVSCSREKRQKDRPEHPPFQAPHPPYLESFVWQLMWLHCLLVSFPFADDIEDKCQKMACECDRSAAKCLAKAPYNMTYLFWPDTQCGEKDPTCPDD